MLYVTGVGEEGKEENKWMQAYTALIESEVGRHRSKL
jgi:hypothetical protein